jgi:hypothetical protein
MADHANKFQAGRSVSWQPNEIEFVQAQVRRELPNKRVQQVQRALDLCKRQVDPSEGREKLLACIREKLQ